MPMVRALIPGGRIRWRWAPPLLVLLLLVAAVAPAVAAEPVPYGQGLLWRIEKRGIAPNHVFGTMHSSDDEIIDLPAPVLDALSQADHAMFEIVVTAEVQKQAARNMLLNDGRVLPQVIGPEMFARVVEAGARYGLSPAVLARFRPEALIFLFNKAPEEEARKAIGQVPLDWRMQIDAHAHGITLYSLETVAEQAEIFNDLPEEIRIGMLAGVIAGASQAAANYQRIKRAYLAGDLDSLYDQTRIDDIPDAYKPLMRNFWKRFIDDRNEMMVYRMQDQLAAGNTFVAVGALHLPGEKGVLNMLARRGWRLTRLH